MLVLGRRVDESLVFKCGKEIIEVIVTEIDGNTVKLGVKADKSIQVMRKELLAKDELDIVRDLMRNDYKITSVKGTWIGTNGGDNNGLVEA